jgi:hypothetical protein
MPVPHRLWWRVTDILPLAAHAAATARHAPFPGRQPTPLYPALVWTSDPNGNWLSSNGIPAWYAADGTGHRVRAETWSHPATGTTGNPAQTDPTDGFLPLLAEHLDGRRTLLALLEFASRHRVHWFGLHPDPVATATTTRYRIAEHRGDLVPPDATWVPAMVTSAAVDGRAYPALIADGYTALDGVLARFPPDSLQTLIEEQREAFLSDDTGTVVQLRQAGALLIVERQEHDDTGLRWVEEDRCHPDADGCYLVGAYQWRRTLA